MDSSRTCRSAIFDGTVSELLRNPTGNHAGDHCLPRKLPRTALAVPMRALPSESAAVWAAVSLVLVWEMPITIFQCLTANDCTKSWRFCPVPLDDCPLPLDNCPKSGFVSAFPD